MFNNPALGVVIGLVFIYLLYSLLGTILQEMVATNIGLRGRVLKSAIERMLNDEKVEGESPTVRFANAFYEHPLIKYLHANNLFMGKKPAYISQQTFSKVMIDLLSGKNITPGNSYRWPIQKSLDVQKIQWNENVAIEKETLLYLKSIWADSQGDVLVFKNYLEQWFNEMMDRTSGWYKKWTQLILMFIGLTLAIGFNVDTISIATTLQKNPALRQQLLSQANEFTKAHPNLDKNLNDQKLQLAALDNETSTKIDSVKTGGKKDFIAAAKKDSLKSSINQLQTVKKLNDSLYNQATQLVNGDIANANNLLGLGWAKGFWTGVDIYSIVGWLLTAFAISLGAPFWFDMLNKLIRLRGAVPEEKKTNKAGTNISITERVG